MTDSDLKQTPLMQWHIDQGAKMVPFAGYNMPVQYPLGVMKEHLHTRANAGLFDVSHMGQIEVTSKDGSDIAEVLETIFPSDLIGLEVGKQTYSLLLNDDGGVLDDLMIGRRADDFLLVVNAACKDDDFAYLQSLVSDKLHLVLRDDKSLLALQGPKAAAVLNSFGADIDALLFMQGASIEVGGIHCWATRSGYTGEDGFELSVANDKAVELVELLVSHDAVEAIGLGARDSLRLEAGLCLYGHELNEDTTPVEASISWAIAKCRKPGGSRAAGFVGYETIFDQLTDGVEQKRVGLVGEGRAPIREGTKLFDEHDNQVGLVTSGGFGPSAEKPVSIAYVATSYSPIGTTLLAEVRNKKLPVTVSKTPFVRNNYYRG